MEASVIRQNKQSEFFTPENCYILELLNKKEVSEFSLARSRVLPGQSTVLHRLRDTTEVYFLLEGKGIVELDGQILGEVNSGDTVFIPANIPQRITNNGNRDLIFLCICTPRFDVNCYNEV